MVTVREFTLNQYLLARGTTKRKLIETLMERDDEREYNRVLAWVETQYIKRPRMFNTLVTGVLLEQTDEPKRELYNRDGFYK